MSNLAEKACAACRGATAALTAAELEPLQQQLDPDWRVANANRLEREFPFKDFRQALQFTNRIGELAEEENHHPDISLAWGKVGVTLWTHKVGGLTESDFVLAAKIDRLTR